MSTSRKRQRGVTLIELIIFMVIVGVAVAGVVGVLNFTAKNSSDPLRRKQALMIAQGLLEEVELAQFTWCNPNSAEADTVSGVADCVNPETFGPEAGKTRPYDNVNDYGNNTYAFNVPQTAAGVLSDASGSPINVSGYTATVSVVPEDLGGIAGGTQANPSVLRVTVTVAYDGSNSVRLDGYRTRYSPKVQ